jgi:hypothetical protein
MRTVILSESTVAALLEAHASMAAWHYELWRVQREGGAPKPPDEATRRAFLSRVAADFPEVASVAKAIAHPRMYQPPPPIVVAPAEPPAGSPADSPPHPKGEGAGG